MWDTSSLFWESNFCLNTAEKTWRMLRRSIICTISCIYSYTRHTKCSKLVLSIKSSTRTGTLRDTEQSSLESLRRWGLRRTIHRLRTSTSTSRSSSMAKTCNLLLASKPSILPEKAEGYCRRRLEEPNQDLSDHLRFPQNRHSEVPRTEDQIWVLLNFASMGLRSWSSWYEIYR